MTRYVFVTGGVVSSLGKGIAAAALAASLQARGYTVRMRKLDPYLNVDPGTMSPFQHGEVFVTDDGAETDLDLGHYERFTGVSCSRSDTVTSGRIYQEIIQRERRGDYLGGTVQVIPHVTDAIKAAVRVDEGSTDFTIVEIGGTVGDIEALPFLEAVRQLRTDLPRGAAVNVHLTLLPYIPSAGELKTKPTQHSVKELRSIGIQPDILLCRSDRPIPEGERRKLALFCNVRPSAVIEALDVGSIYEVPLAYNASGLDREVLDAFGIADAPAPDLSRWRTINERMSSPRQEVRIAVVGKYTGLKDAYKSIIEALTHAGIANRARVTLDWVDSETLDPDAAGKRLEDADGILVPGGFGHRGVEGKIAAIRHARENGVPFLGICLGMQLSVIEAARNLAGIEEASSTEFGPTPDPVICLMTEWRGPDGTEQRTEATDLGGTMRLGAQEASLLPGSVIHAVYGTDTVSERHRHRYEFNGAYVGRIERTGLVVSGKSPDGMLPEAVEYPGHPFFVAVQYHPELKSRPFAPHPLFASFVAAAGRPNC